MRTLLAASAALALTAFSCKPKDLDLVGKTYAPEPQARTAAEWIERFKTRAALGDAGIAQLYADLPPKTEWKEIIAFIRNDDLTENLHVRDRYRLFAELLDENPIAADRLLENLMDRRRGEYCHSLHGEAIRYFTLSTDPKAPERWMRKYIDDRSPRQPPDIADPPPPPLEDEDPDRFIEKLWAELDRESHEEAFAILSKLVVVGETLGRSDLTEKALQRFKEKTAAGTFPESSSLWKYLPIIETLARRGDWTFIHEFTREAGRRSDHKPHDPFLTLRLMTIHRMKGSQALLDALAGLPAYDIQDTRSYLALLTKPTFERKIFGEEVVNALLGQGERDAAHALLWTLLALQGGNDSLYQMALLEFPEEASAYFHKLRRYNPYEERPLIWLAEQALAAGDASSAREWIDQAIQLDPSDGEQGKDTRMQAYDVLSRILITQGDEEASRSVRRILEAIREGERADTLLSLDMKAEAIRCYERALERFDDAYCLQSRLAVTLLQAGRFEEAKAHFRKAFDLMPTSFGPVESHCLGCEGIFKDEKVQLLARESFTRSLRQAPENPRTHYLLALLLVQQDRKDEAAASFRRALELDPHYYNAARKLHELLSSNPRTARKALALVPHLVETAPYADAANYFHARIDLAQAWHDAQSFPPNPLDLPAVPVPFTLARPAPSQEPYCDLKIDGLDGWSADELLRGNSLMGWINGL